MAEEWYPGISRMYEELQDKSVTFLQLLWLYEGRRELPADAESADSDCGKSPS